MFGPEITLHSYISNLLNASDTSWESLGLETQSLVKALQKLQ